ncbi:MAG: hypothetical protein ACTHJQ_22625 [Rhizobiaceae bacterium]
MNLLAEALRRAAGQLGVSPVDLGTVVGYETGGTFDPLQKGPVTQWGQHRGLIQWGEPQAAKYLNGDFSIPSQANGMVSYLQDAGVKPGMGLLDLYSAVNAGHVGRYNASDANNGGAPGTVADKVQTMGPFRQKAEALLGQPAGPSPSSPAGGALAASGMQPSAPTQPPASPMVANAGIPSDVAAYATSDQKQTPLQKLGAALQKYPDAPRAPNVAGPSATNGSALLQYMQNPRQLAEMFLKQRLGQG